MYIHQFPTKAKHIKALFTFSFSRTSFTSAAPLASLKLCSFRKAILWSSTFKETFVINNYIMIGYNDHRYLKLLEKQLFTDRRFKDGWDQLLRDNQIVHKLAQLPPHLVRENIIYSPKLLSSSPIADFLVSSSSPHFAVVNWRWS